MQLSDVPDSILAGLRLLVPFAFFAFVGLIIVNILLRGTPLIVRVSATVVFSSLLALPSILAGLENRPFPQKPGTALAVFLVSVPLLWLFVFRPEATMPHASPPPSDRYLF